MNNVFLRRCVRRSPVVVLGVLSFVGFGLAPRTVLSAQQVALRMQATPLPATAVDQSALPQSTPVGLTLYLQPGADRVNALAQFLVDVQTPGNAAYKAWLSPAQFGQQFGATADQVARVSAWAQANGLTVGSVAASGLSVSLTGTAAHVESALAPGLHNVLAGNNVYVAVTAVPEIAQSVAGDIVAVGGLNTLPASHPFTVTTSAGTTTENDVLAAMNTLVAANASRVVSLSSASCVEDVDSASQAAMHLLLQQANAQGITVLAASGCGSRGSAGYPAAFSEVTAAAPSVGIMPPANPTLSELRPGWQDAPGLPGDAFRHEPDFAVSSMTALQQTVNKILASFPASADGTPARLGNINGTLYELAPVKGLYTQPDHATAGTWEAATGLGLVDLGKLADAYPNGTLSSYTSIDLSPYSGPHGTTFTFTSTVKDISGKGNGVVPTGSVTFSFGSSYPSQTVALNTSGTATYQTNQLPAGSISVTSTYSGDGTYATSTSVTDTFTISGEAADISAAQQGTAQVGGDIVLTVTVKADSGVGTPTGKVTVQPRGGTDSNTYTGTLSGSNSVATATVLVPATQASGITLLVNCDGSNPNYTCYSAQQFTPSISKATPQVTLSYTPTPVASGQSETFTATVYGAGNGAASPAGNINFSNNGVVIGSGTLSSSGIATLTTSNFNYSSSGNTFVATYGGDNNYNSNTSSASGSTSTIATTTTVGVSSTTVPIGGTATLYAVVSPATTGSAMPGGTVSFVVGSTTLCTGTVTGETASCSATFTARGANGPIEANYSGDTNFAASSSGSQYVTVSVVQGNTQVVVTASPATPVSGQPTTFTATVTNTNGSASTAAITGNLSFYVNGSAVNGIQLTNGQATYTTTLPNGTDTVYAVYSGNSNWNGSQSSTATYTLGSSSSGSSSTIVLTSNTTSSVAGANITLTATITPPSGSTNSASYSGSVTFYDQYNGAAAVAIATENVVSSGPGGGSAQFSTTGLQSGTHVLTAVYSGNSSYASETSSSITITLGDYSLSFAPASLTMTAGSSGSSTLTIASLTGFTSTVTLSCIPPTQVNITCSFSPASVSAGGTSTLTVITQINHAENEQLWLRGTAGGVALAALLFGFLVPGRRRRAPALLAFLLTVAVIGSLGCTNLKNASTGSPLSGGTPAGVYNLSISSASVNQGVTVTHSQQFQVTVQ